MEIEVRQLVDENEMLSHIFLGCISKEELRQIKDKFIGEVDWKEESCKIPVTMTIGGVDVNPKNFFDEWRNQMQKIVEKEANRILKQQLSGRLTDLIKPIQQIEQVFDYWVTEVNWEVKNPLL